MDVVGDIFPLGVVHEPRQLREVHCIEVEEMAAARKAGHRGIHRMVLPGRHYPI